MQLRDRHQEIRATGGDVVAIGMGWPAAAAAFKDEFDIPFPLLVDHDRTSYNALGMQRGSLWEITGPPVWIRGIRNILKGQQPLTKPKQDPLQLGGTLVVAPDDEVLLLHRSKTSSDNLPVDEMIAALQRGT